jgi:hypothetical protein
MTNKHDDEQEPKDPETLEEALFIIACHLIIFVLKVGCIVAGWMLMVELLKKMLMQ